MLELILRTMQARSERKRTSDLHFDRQGNDKYGIPGALEGGGGEFAVLGQTAAPEIHPPAKKLGCLEMI
jgi:hypothetical protein